jgi:hypothetical protein
MKHQKVQSETTKGAPEGPEVVPKRSTSKSNQRSQIKHQKVQSETTKGAPERLEVLPKRSTSKPNQRVVTSWRHLPLSGRVSESGNLPLGRFWGVAAIAL